MCDELPWRNFFRRDAKTFSGWVGRFCVFFTLNDSPFSRPFFICGNVGCVPYCDKRATTGRWGGSASSHTCTHINKRVRVNICGTPSKAATAIVHTPHSFGCSWHREYMTRAKENLPSTAQPQNGRAESNGGENKQPLIIKCFPLFFFII
jgi:hypothetical protein